MVNRIYFRGSRSNAKAVIGQAVASLGGRSSRYATFAASIHTVIGLAALSDIKLDFIRKSQGETGQDGVKWKPLSPKTLAYGRRAPKGKGFAPGGKDGLLTSDQLKRWNQVFGTRLARLAMSMPIGQAKATAAKIAWAVVKEEGGRTKIEAYASRPHEILKDTAELLNSLSPGQIGDDGVNLTAAKVQSQVFEVSPGRVIVGTNVHYAAVHQYGSAKQGIPARPFIPEDVPEQWTNGWMEDAKPSIVQMLSLVLNEAA
jgi:hypothetical protein